MKTTNIDSGARFTDKGYEFDYAKDNIEDIVHLTGPKLYESNIDPNIYWFGYRFNDNISSKARADFIHSIKELSPRISEQDLIAFIDRPLFELDKVLSTYHIDAMVYPLSSRSPIVTKIIREINKYSSKVWIGYRLPYLNQLRIIYHLTGSCLNLIIVMTKINMNR